MGKRVLLLLSFVLCFGCAHAFAQTSTLTWNQPQQTLSMVQGNTYTLKVDNAAPVQLTATCTGPDNSASCTAPITNLPAGVHTLILTATNQFGSAASAPLIGQAPNPPLNVRIVIIVGDDDDQ